MPPPGSVVGLQRRQRDDDRDKACHSYTIRDQEIPGRGIRLSPLRTTGAAEIVVGMWVVFLEAATARSAERADLRTTTRTTDAAISRPESATRSMEIKVPSITT
jgi:hypothetical protein